MQKYECIMSQEVILWSVYSDPKRLMKFLTTHSCFVLQGSSNGQLCLLIYNMIIFWVYRVLTPVQHWMATYEFMVVVVVYVDVLPPQTSVQLLQPLPHLEILLRSFHARFVGSKWMPTNVYVSLKDWHKVNFSFVFMPGVLLGLHPNLT